MHRRRPASFGLKRMDQLRADPDNVIIESSVSLTHRARQALVDRVSRHAHKGGGLPLDRIIAMYEADVGRKVVRVEIEV